VVLLVVLLLVVMVLVLVAAVAVVATVRTRSRKVGVEDLPADVVGLRQEVAALRQEARGALRHLGLVRYDAFASNEQSVGGRLSWSLALVDDQGDGVVLTAIHGRSEARSYAKSLAGWSCEQPMSPEEHDAVASAKP
jgi:Protein of unknown function (DUF4446)